MWESRKRYFTSGVRRDPALKEGSKKKTLQACEVKIGGLMGKNRGLSMRRDYKY